MRIKRLEIQGFKSFKDKTVIHFDHCITGIVGPNGCGKSNIVDAFFWVMGEQSYKHMRGNSSEDLIFNGSSKYSPMGIAEATLILETQAVDLLSTPSGATTQNIPIHLKTKEISVTRRLYRSGEGEYFINGTLARLKDIQELFMDTGVGAKGYSVIEQGQIGKIVNAKPEERRLLIEEAAGIAKYKARKKESLRKMEATQANLARLTDIIQEIEKNLGSLERQALKAQQYKKYKDELIQKEMTWGRRKNKVLTEKLNALKNQKEEFEQDLDRLRAELQTSENSMEVDRIQLITETKEAETLQAKIQDLASELSHEKSALDLSKRRQGDLVSQLEALENEKTELEVSLQENTARLTQNEKEALEGQILYQKVAVQSQEAQEKLTRSRKEVETARSQLDSTQRELMAGMDQISSLTSKTAALFSKSESAQGQLERFLQQKQMLLEKKEGIEGELEKFKTQFEKISEKRESLETESLEKTSHLRSEEESLRSLEQGKTQSLHSLTQLKSRLQSLEELDESHEGLADGPKAALDWAKAQGYQHQVMALTDTLSVSSGYEAVLETWLEERIENLLSQDPAIDPLLIQQIQKDNQGRVRVQLHLDLDSSKKKDSSDSYWKALQTLLESQNFKVLGKLSDFVSSTLKNSEILSSLISQVCLVESSLPLAEFLKNQGLEALQGWSIVSMDGMVLEPHGMLRGGKSEASGVIGVLRRKRSIEELKVQRDQAQQEYQQFEERVSEAQQDLEISQARLQTLQRELQSLEVQAAGLERDIHQTEKAFKDSTALLSSLDRDIQAIQKEADQALQERDSVELQLKDLRVNRAGLEESLLLTEENLRKKEEILRLLEDELQSIRVHEASLKERSSSLKREYEATRSLIADRERRVIEVDKILKRASVEQAQFSGGESELEERIEELTFILSESRDKLSQVKDRMEKANHTIQGLLEKTKVLHKKGEQKTSEATQLALEIEKISGDLSHLILNLEEKYGPGCLDSASIHLDISLEITPDEELLLSEDVERLKERIRRLGEVNMMAIEEFDQLKKRADHLLTEKSDLEQSLENLQKAIEHINKTSEERFKKAFEAIADRFERLFPIIFGGGQAKLSLLYPEGSQDILEAGVDILAQPPGKKVSNITLLSGGEKALTAVSLIFAIFMVKPSPFCVLDEVDAPLDDANIGKFNALLREMSVKSQFILITHNKKTMELNDTLYGVTMEEPGVSKMVSIEMH